MLDISNLLEAFLRPGVQDQMQHTGHVEARPQGGRNVD